MYPLVIVMILHKQGYISCFVKKMMAQTQCTLEKQKTLKTDSSNI